MSLEQTISSIRKDLVQLKALTEKIELSLASIDPSTVTIDQVAVSTTNWTIIAEAKDSDLFDSIRTLANIHGGDLNKFFPPLCETFHKIKISTIFPFPAEKMFLYLNPTTFILLTKKHISATEDLPYEAFVFFDNAETILENPLPEQFNLLNKKIKQWVERQESPTEEVEVEICSTVKMTS